MASSTGAKAQSEALDACRRFSIGAVYHGHPLYPGSLLETPDPPAILFYRGDIRVLERKCVAVIGSRRCSLYGRKAARNISMLLCGAGACVVSGLARGIDSEAHRGALDASGATAAVMAGGLDAVYPPEHSALAGRIAGSGCLLSEYPPGVSPSRFSFPERNRIISGLSEAVVVVEAGEKSGTMITVGTALDQGRDVYAVPGDMGRSSCGGTNRLIRDGAGIVLSPHALLEELGFSPEQASTPSRNDPLLSLLAHRSLTIEQISAALEQDAISLSADVLSLELAGLVVRRPGNRYSGL